VLKGVYEWSLKGSWERGLTGHVLWGVKKYSSTDHVKSSLEPDFKAPEDLRAA
jgi:hypothetical protein